MIVTEKEAQDLWCPFSRQQDGANRYGTVPMGWCLGSKCMAWRWAWSPHDPETSQKTGFCGLTERSEE